MQESKSNSQLQILTEKYEQNIPLRGLVQLIPYVGGAIDLVLSDRGQKFRQQRLDGYLEALSSCVDNIQGKFIGMLNEAPEEVFDLLRSHLDEVDRSRDQERREQFANILLNQAHRRATWSEPETATRLLRSLTSLHISVLKEMCNAPACKDPFRYVSGVLQTC